jgi:hypothetical protein
MSVQDIISIVKPVFSGRDGFSSFGENPNLLLVVFVPALLTISVTLVRNRSYGPAASTFLLATLLSGVFYIVQNGQAHVDHPSPPSQLFAFRLHTGKVLIGGDLATADGHRDKMSLDDCHILCSAEGRCAAFTYDTVQQACYLKRLLTTMHAFDSAVTGIKPGQVFPQSPVKAAAQSAPSM